MGTFFPALICGICCYLGAIECTNPLGTTGSNYCLGRPFVAGLVVGLAFGNVSAGILCGVAVQAVFIANLSTGGATNSEITYASYGGIGLAMATTQDPALAVTLSVLIGNTFGLIFYNLRMAYTSFFNNKAFEAAEKGDSKGITMWHIIVPQICTFLIRFVPVFAAIYLGEGFVNNVANNAPVLLTYTISVLGGVLPALGVGLLMSIIVKKDIQLVFFLVGFALCEFIGLGTIPMIFVAAVIAYLYYLAIDKPAAVAVEAAADNDGAFEDADLF